MIYDRQKFDRELMAEYEAQTARADEEGRELARRIREDLLSDKPLVSVVDRFAGRKHKTNEERLAYYRIHGLDRCDDYPGGDAAFEADVLSGKYHDENGTWPEPGREDAYVIARMEDGRFKFTREFRRYGWSPFVFRAFLDNCHKNGFDVG